MRRDFIQTLRAEIDKRLQDLEPVETGKMRLGERIYGGSWVDVTDREIGSLSASFGRTIARVKNRVNQGKPPRAASRLQGARQ
jgi:hypothetical protein